MTIRHGRNCGIFINGVDLSGDVNAVTVASEQELADVTTFGQVGHTLYPGLAKDTGTIEALYNSTSAAVFNSMLQIQPSYPMMITFGQALGDPAYGCNEAMLNNHSIKGVVSDVNRASFTVDVDNWPFEPGRLLTPGIYSALGGSFVGVGIVDNGSASGTTGGAAYLQVTQIYAGGPLIISIQDCSTNVFAGAETTTCTFATATTTGAQRVAITSQIKQYSRCVEINNGTSTAKFAVSLVRY